MLKILLKSSSLYHYCYSYYYSYFILCCDIYHQLGYNDCIFIVVLLQLWWVHLRLGNADKSHRAYIMRFIDLLINNCATLPPIATP